MRYSFGDEPNPRCGADLGLLSPAGAILFELLPSVGLPGAAPRAPTATVGIRAGDGEARAKWSTGGIGLLRWLVPRPGGRRSISVDVNGPGVTDGRRSTHARGCHVSDADWVASPLASAYG